MIWISRDAGVVLPASTLFGRKIPTAFIYTMNLPEQQAKERHYQVHFGTNEEYLTKIFGQAETLCCYETLQMEDYSKVVFNYYACKKIICVK